jgi:hypothetical protein
LVLMPWISLPRGSRAVGFFAMALMHWVSFHGCHAVVFLSVFPTQWVFLSVAVMIFFSKMPK